MVKTTRNQKISLIILSLILSIVIIEISLRIGGYFVLPEGYYKDEIQEDDNIYKILALGDSTTESWTDMLQEILEKNSSGIEFRVINRGIPGANTGLILSKLNDNLNRFSPDMVITMMGIHDENFNYGKYGGFCVRYNEGIRSGILLTLKNLRVLKLSNWLMNSWHSKYVSMMTDEDMEKYDIEDIEELNNRYFSLGYAYLKQGECEKAEEVFTKAFEINLKNSENSGVIGETIRKLITCYQENTGSTLNIYKLVSYYKNDSFKLVKPSASCIKVTGYNYRKMHEILSENNIRHIAMQYPTLNLDKLKEFFSEDEDIIFVDNRPNFREAKGDKYNEYFNDKFGITFGHATKKGNRLIAENVADVILEELNAG